MPNPKLDCLNEIKNALQHRGDAWRIASLASVDQCGLPQVRSVVVRDVDLTQSQLMVFTDRRSPKVAELMANPQAALLLWCPTRQQQLRLSCSVAVLEGIESYWQNVAHSHGIRDYATQLAPGSDLEDGLSLDIASAAEHFCVLAFTVQTIDRLWLSREGHRRQRISTSGVQDICP